MCVRIFAYCVHAKSAGISIKTSHEHLLLHCPAVPLKVAKFQVAKNKRIDRRFIYISDSLLSLTLPASDFHPSHRRGKCLACISLLFADSSARVLAPQACENHCKFSINFKTIVSCCKKKYTSHRTKPDIPKPLRHMSVARLQCACRKALNSMKLSLFLRVL